MFVRPSKIADPVVARTFEIVDKILDGALYYYSGHARTKTGQNDLYIFRIPYYVEPGTGTQKNAWQRGDLHITHAVFTALGAPLNIDITVYGSNDGAGLTSLGAATISIAASGGTLQEDYRVAANVDLSPYDFLIIEYDPAPGFPDTMAGVSILWRPAVA